MLNVEIKIIMDSYEIEIFPSSFLILLIVVQSATSCDHRQLLNFSAYSFFFFADSLSLQVNSIFSNLFIVKIPSRQLWALASTSRTVR